MGVLAAKILLAPSFVVVASLAARRYGSRIGGLIGGLPVVAGPILLVFALSHGATFAAHAATATLLGIVSLIAFVVVYVHLAERTRWITSVLLGWGAFFAMTGLLSAVDLDASGALVAVLAAIGVGLALFPRASDEPVSAARPPRWDLPLRGLSALGLVLALTALAGELGAKLSGLLAPFPVIASVLAVFTHAHRGEQEVARIMRGFVLGLVAYAAFCFVLAISLERTGIAAGFALATAVALVIQSAALALSSHRTPRPEPRDAALADDARRALRRTAGARARRAARRAPSAGG